LKVTLNLDFFLAPVTIAKMIGKHVHWSCVFCITHSMVFIFGAIAALILLLTLLITGKILLCLSLTWLFVCIFWWMANNLLAMWSCKGDDNQSIWLKNGREEFQKGTEEVL
jgi:hypothetical protein